MMTETKEKQFRLRIPELLYTQLEGRARSRFRSVNSQILAILSRGVDEWRAGRGLPMRGFVRGEEKVFALRVPTPLYTDLEAWAEEERRSVNGQIIVILEASVTEGADNALESVTESPVSLPVFTH